MMPGRLTHSVNLIILLFRSWWPVVTWGLRFHTVKCLRHRKRWSTNAIFWEEGKEFEKRLFCAKREQRFLSKMLFNFSVIVGKFNTIKHASGWKTYVPKLTLCSRCAGATYWQRRKCWYVEPYFNKFISTELFMYVAHGALQFPRTLCKPGPDLPVLR